jgi:hypothetical protein
VLGLQFCGQKFGLYRCLFIGILVPTCNRRGDLAISKISKTKLTRKIHEDNEKGAIPTVASVLDSETKMILVRTRAGHWASSQCAGPGQKGKWERRSAGSASGPGWANEDRKKVFHLFKSL